MQLFSKYERGIMLLEGLPQNVGGYKKELMTISGIWLRIMAIDKTSTFSEEYLITLPIELNNV